MSSNWGVLPPFIWAVGVIGSETLLLNILEIWVNALTFTVIWRSSLPRKKSYKSLHSFPLKKLWQGKLQIEASSKSFSTSYLPGELFRSWQLRPWDSILKLSSLRSFKTMADVYVLCTFPWIREEIFSPVATEHPNCQSALCAFPSLVFHVSHVREESHDCPAGFTNSSFNRLSRKDRLTKK